MVYDIDGKQINNFGINYEYRRHENGAFYSILNIPQKDIDGNVQYPFVIWPNYPNGGNMSVMDMNQSAGFKYTVAINGGTFNSPYGKGVTLSGVPVGTVIQNGVVLSQGTASSDTKFMRDNCMVLTVDQYGALGYADFEDSGETMIANGIVSAVTGFIPIVTNFLNADDVIEQEMPYMDGENDSQRQVIGQYGNGDYCIITSAGRDDQGGSWFTVKQMQTFCKQLGLKEAFMLDCGGSTQTVVGKKQLNTVYDNLTGRVVPTYIVFNGTSRFISP